MDYTAQEAADRIGVSRAAILMAIGRGKLLSWKRANVRFIDRAQSLVSLLCNVESYSGDSFNFRDGVAHRVKTFIFSRFRLTPPSRLTEINIPRQLTQNHDV